MPESFKNVGLDIGSWFEVVCYIEVRKRIFECVERVSKTDGSFKIVNNVS